MCEQTTTNGSNGKLIALPVPEPIQSFPYKAFPALLARVRARVNGGNAEDPADNENVNIDQEGGFFVSASTRPKSPGGEGASAAAYGLTRLGNVGIDITEVVWKGGHLEFDVTIYKGKTHPGQTHRLAYEVTDGSAVFEGRVDTSTEALAINPLCILQCGGGPFLSMLIKSLPALVAGGPAALIASLVTDAPPQLISAINCIAKNCF
jgi:hypothetical protein